jgi:hypothetical protein
LWLVIGPKEIFQKILKIASYFSSLEESIPFRGRDLAKKETLG